MRLAFAIPALVAAVAIATALLLAAMNRDETPDVDQPVQFNHKVHLEEGLGCADCHVGVETQSHATRPTADACRLCHEEAIGEGDAERELVEMLRGGGPLRWNAVYDLPAHVNFSHARHVRAGELACTECHGDMASLERPPRRPTTPNTLWMDRCMECHQQRNVSNDCYSCHR